MDTLKLSAPAKINLTLFVTGRRADGYHQLDMLMVKLALADGVELRRRRAGIVVHCPDSDLPEDGGNLVHRAAAAALGLGGVDGGVEITLRKNVPIAAGLGGGSSDAAAVLSGVLALYGSRVGGEALHAAAVGLGADVPFFLFPGRAARARGIGDVLDEVALGGSFWVVLVNPGFAVSTRNVYANFALTSASNPYIVARKQESVLSGIPQFSVDLHNDLESVTCREYPELLRIKDAFRGQGAFASLMSGSGPTVFGLFRNRQEAEASRREMAASHPIVILTTIA
ncbi:MAG: 4-(cytidine 5'-diphospho)-2-C-methyl-D-erythritol kinase [Thermodesulfobacteriota bacterium]